MEGGEPAHLEATGGLRWGRSFWLAWNATLPFARLEATPQSLKLTVRLGFMSPRFELSRSDVTRISRRRGLLSSGLHVEHDRPDLPRFLLFWTRSSPALLSQLQSLGYPVDV